MSARRALAGALAAAQPLPRPTGRPRSEECRQRILAAARDLLEERGLRAMTMEAIAERAGTSKVTLYRWWPHKAVIVLDAMLAEVSPRSPHRESTSPVEALHTEMKSLCRVLHGRVGRLLVGVVAEGALDPEVGAAYREHWVKPRRDAARLLIERAIQDGTVKPETDPEVTLDALFGPLYYRFLIGHLSLNMAFVDSVFESVMRGIATPRTRAKLGLVGRRSGE